MDKINNFITEFNPVFCSCSTFEMYTPDIFETQSYYLGWLTYTRDPAFIVALTGDPLATAYRNGLLIKIGEDVSTAESPETRAQLIRLRDKLTAAGVTGWTM